MKLGLCIFFLFFIVSCIDSKKIEIHFFNLEHIEIHIPHEKIKDPHGIVLAGDNKFILLNGQTSKFFDLFDLTQGKYTSFGIKGRGPGEMLSAVTLSYDYVNESVNSYDMMTGDYNSISLSDISKGQDKCKKLFTVDRSNGWPKFFIPFDDSLYLANGTFKHNRFGLFNNKGKLLEAFGNFPDGEFNKKMSNLELASGYSGRIRSHPSKPLFVADVPHSDLIEIYEKDGDSFQRLNSTYQPEYPPCFKVIQMGDNWSTSACKNSIIGFTGCAVSDLFIFSAFSNDNIRVLSKGKMIYPTILRVYDWQGRYKANLSLDFPIVVYTIKRVGKVHIIYAIVENDGNPINPFRMVKYEVKL